MFALQCPRALELPVLLMALVIFSDSGSATVLCTYMLPAYTQSVIKLPVILRSEHCMFGMVCKDESQAYCLSRASITFLIAVRFSVQRTSVEARSQEPLAAAVHPRRCRAGRGGAGGLAGLQVAQSGPYGFVSPQSTSLHPTM